MLLSVDEALSRIHASIRPARPQSVPIAQAAGRVLAAPILAQTDNPPFDASAMDGYAVRADDVDNGSVLTLVGTSQAGAAYAGTVQQGQCVRIFTGAPVPAGADSVVMQEQTQAVGNAVTFLAECQTGKNVRPLGHDFTAGSILVPAGTTVTPAIVALIAAANHATCAIAKPPRLALMATGDELVLPGTALAPDHIVASNSFGLSALFAPFCDAVIDHGIVPDDREVLGKAISEALEAKPDILLTTGGASVGEHDFVQDMLKANGVEIDFWRIAMRPGKPLMFGRKGDTLVFGLPGNPVSAMVTAQVFVLPAVRAILGTPEPAPLVLPLADALPANGPRRHFIRARLAPCVDGRTGVAAIGQTDSGHLSSLSRSDCLIVQREHDQGKQTGDLVDVILL